MRMRQIAIGLSPASLLHERMHGLYLYLEHNRGQIPWQSKYVA